MNARLELTLKVIERIRKVTDSEEIRSDVDFGCTNPAQMNATVFERLQALSESLDMSLARGEDCIPGFDEEQVEVDRLMDAAPWTLDHDKGLVRKDEASSEPSIS